MIGIKFIFSQSLRADCEALNKSLAEVNEQFSRMKVRHLKLKKEATATTRITPTQSPPTGLPGAVSATTRTTPTQSHPTGLPGAVSIYSFYDAFKPGPEAFSQQVLIRDHCSMTLPTLTHGTTLNSQLLLLGSV